MLIKKIIIMPLFLWAILIGSADCEQKIFTNEKINFIHSGSASDIWVGTNNGLYRIKDEKYKDAVNIKKGEEIKGIVEDSTNNIYFAVGKKIVYYGTGRENEEKTVEPFGMGRDDSFIKFMAFDKNNIWIGRHNDMFASYDGRNFKTYPVWDVNSIDFSASGDVWIGAVSGLYCLKKGVLEEFKTENSPLPDNNIISILFDDYDNLWIATNNGLVKYNQHVWIIYNKENSPLKDNQVTSIYLDKNGSLIVGVQSGDIQIIKNNKWQESSAALKNQAINSIYRDSKGLLLLGTDSGLVISK